mgnify:CR=1 FL=1
MPKWCKRVMDIVHCALIKSKYGTFNRIRVPDTPHIWQTMQSGIFYAGIEDEFRDVMRFGESDPEYIWGVAIRHQSGVVFAGEKPYRHNHLVWMMSCCGCSASTDQGFLTSQGRYLDREEGLSFAKTTDQLIRKTGCESELFSEDLWDIPETLNIYKPKGISQ